MMARFSLVVLTCAGLAATAYQVHAQPPDAGYADVQSPEVIPAEEDGLGDSATAGYGHSQGPLAKFARSVVRDWKRNNCWPEPFFCPDRGHVRAPFVAMVDNGWQRQNLLGAFHFEADSGILNPAGEEKLRWILTEVPEHHRTVYVSRGAGPDETAARMASVEKSASQIVREGPIPAIVETSISSGGWPAERVDVINRKFQESTPAPRLPKTDAAGNDQ